MQMRVNGTLIREHRIKRGWSQEQLAMVSGLGLRTVHRIENEGVGSYESIMAIAAAMSLEVEALTETYFISPAANSARFLKLELLFRLGLAMVSGILVPILLDVIIFGELVDLSPDTWSNPGEQLLAEFLGGLLFGALVLVPFTAKTQQSIWKYCALVLTGAFSFIAAVYALFFTMENYFGETINSYLLASVVGGAIVLVAARLLLNIIIPPLAWLSAAIVLLVGGAYMYLVILVLGDYEFMTLASMTGFCLWHGSLVVLLFDSRSGTGGETILDPIVKWLDNKCGRRIDFLLNRLIDSRLDKSEPDAGSSAPSLPAMIQ